MIAKFAGKCNECGGRIEPGQSIIYSQSMGSRHTGCEPRGSREARSAPAAETKVKPIRFALVVGRPSIIALKYATGKRMPSRYPGKPDQVLYTLTDDRVWYASLEEAAEVDSLHVGAREPFSVCPWGAGQIQVERVAPVGGAAQPAPANGAAVSHGQQVAAAPAAKPQPSSSLPQSMTAPAGKVNGQGEDVPAIMRRCYHAAIDIALDAVETARGKGLMLSPSFEDIRAMAATLCINETGGRR